MGGMSGAWWRNQHNKHHATPQKLQHDVDLDTLPLVAFHAKIAARARSPLVKLWLRLQCYLFIPVSCLLVASGWQLYLHPRHALRTKRKRELACMALRYVLLFGVVLRAWTTPSGRTWRTTRSPRATSSRTSRLVIPTCRSPRRTSSCTGSSTPRSTPRTSRPVP